MKTVLAVLCSIVAMVAIASITFADAERNQSAAALCTDDGAEPADSARIGRQFRVNCASVDAGTATTELLVPLDGGTAGKPMEADTLYVAPTAGSSVKVRVGFNDTAHGALTSSTGFQVGTDARDGVGVSLDVSRGANPRCKSEGAAQAVDVVVGRN